MNPRKQKKAPEEKYREKPADSLEVAQALELARMKQSVAGKENVDGTRFSDDCEKFSYGEESINTIQSNFQLGVIEEVDEDMVSNSANAESNLDLISNYKRFGYVEEESKSEREIEIEEPPTDDHKLIPSLWKQQIVKPATKNNVI